MKEEKKNSMNKEEIKAMEEKFNEMPRVAKLAEDIWYTMQTNRNSGDGKAEIGHLYINEYANYAKMPRITYVEYDLQCILVKNGDEFYATFSEVETAEFKAIMTDCKNVEDVFDRLTVLCREILSNLVTDPQIDDAIVEAIGASISNGVDGEKTGYELDLRYDGYGYCDETWINALTTPNYYFKVTEKAGVDYVWLENQYIHWTKGNVGKACEAMDRALETGEKVPFNIGDRHTVISWDLINREIIIDLPNDEFIGPLKWYFEGDPAKMSCEERLDQYRKFFMALLLSINSKY